MENLRDLPRDLAMKRAVDQPGWGSLALANYQRAPV
jgi:hypothetical protein